jgi:hypothetical protein
LRRAADNAHAAPSTQVSHDHLDDEAGQPLEAPTTDRHGTPATRTGEEPTREEIETAPIEHKGNMAATLRASSSASASRSAMPS